ncbi:uncharacterized protein BDZ99DRAFT_153596 [Mytilinidion resinicola]|uniref:Integral membrane protein n=1 Tax=Mytilinidion resinicola TaxID=574789 RepID=A0A6A6Y5R3_9PEZI|nr:uncharacterized protein BDZ99DRAFT_153596 [Mytilinidion resinicola]KAF2804146.1 hypothetical protein BDZ99DRAFT_153596 [Mytilinidion resinicola]
MQFTALVLSVSGLLLSSRASAQSVIDYTKLPACAKQCSILSQAEANCVPPAAPVTNQDTYQSCFCQSGLLTTLKTSPSLCQSSATNTICTPQDATTIEQYYVALCNGPTVQPAETTTTTTSTATSTAAGTATGTASAGNKGVSENSSNNDWFSTHWKWVVMLIVIFLFMIIASVLGVWLKRRHRRRADARRANMAASDAPVADAAFHDAVAKDMAMSGVLPTPPPVRTRSGTMTSRGSSRLSKHHPPSDPVVWGPHQYASTWNDGSQQDYVRQPKAQAFGRHEQVNEAEPSHLREVKL